MAAIFSGPSERLPTLFNHTQKPLTNSVPVCVTGTGVISCAGLGADALWNAAVEGKSFVESGLGKLDDDLLDRARTECEKSQFYPALANMHAQLPKSKFGFLALYAALKAMEDAGWDKLNSDDGLILGTTTGNILSWEDDFIAFGKGEIGHDQFAEAFRHEPLGKSLDTVRTALDFDGRNCLVTSACSSSTQAIAQAAMWIREGKAKRVLVGGAEVLCQLTIRGFQSLQLLSEKACTPFDANRSGINLSEGAGFLCLEAGPSPHARALVSGHGFSSDGYHMTAPHPEGRGSYEAMEQAIASAGIAKRDISWIHAHGTGSPANDFSEGTAISQLFGEESVWVSSTKGVHGHALGASGIIESILCVKAIEHQTLVKTRGLNAPDPRMRLKHPTENRRELISHILKNSLGFGGANASLVLSSLATMVIP